MNTLSIILLATALTTAVCQAQRLDWKQYGAAKEGFYVGVSVRPTSVDATIRSATIAGLTGSNQELTFDPGIAFSVPVGYNFGNGFRAEVEPNLYYAAIDTAEGGTTVDGDFMSFSLMANVFYEYANDTKFNPYLGFGVGPTINSLEIDNVNNASVSASADDIALGWQIMPGVNYQLTPQVSFGVGYRYFGSSKTTESGLTLQDITIHSVEFNARYIF